jgi:hypothetical protein
MSQEETAGDQVVEELLRRGYPHVRLTEEGEYAIPRDKFDLFMREYFGQLNASEHMEQLRAYRASGQRDDNADMD